MLLALLSAGALAATCPEPTDTQTLATALAAAESAFVGMSLEAFEDARGRALDTLPCLGEPLTPADAAQLHRVEAYAAFLAQDPAAAERALVSMLRASPSAGLPSTAAPPGHPLHDILLAARETEPALQPLSPAAGGSLVVDGNRVLELPINEPAVLQLVLDSGGVRWTELLQPGAPLPEWEVAAPPSLTPAPQEPPPATDFSTLTPPEAHPWPLAGAALGGVAASVFLLGGSLLAAEAYENDATTVEEADRYRSRTNGLIVGSGLTGAAALSLGVVAAVRW